MAQQCYDPTDYCFQWTDDGWYTWDRERAHKVARKDRDDTARDLFWRRGRKIRKSSIRNQTITKGGVGTPYPEITLTCTIYIVESD